MAFTIEKQFSVEAPVEKVWDFLTDPHRVARCLPGASITEQIDERTFGGKMNIKVGPVATSYKGKITFEHLDRDAGTAELTGRGQDVRGRGGADMRMKSQLVQEGNTTQVSVVTDVNVTGILAQFGRGMIQEVSDQMFQTFTDRMRRDLTEGEGGAAEDAATEAAPGAAPPAPKEEALDVVSLGAAVGSRVAARLVRRPVFWLGIVAVVVIVYLLTLR